MTLVEVMIALLILSVGLLGLAGLQINGLRGTSGANSRVQATFIITDMVERMHANSVAVNTTLSYAAVVLNANACGNAPANDCRAGACDTAQLATFDNFEICQAMADTMPASANLSITCTIIPCAQDTTHTLILSWFDVRDASLAVNPAQSITLTIQPLLPLPPLL